MAKRRYHVHALIGQGGFGRVYRATLDAGGGFRKQVAIKLLKPEATAHGIVERFRDEARILALLRDRAFVSVDPPLRLAGCWAVVMDYVEGESARGLFRYGVFPLTVGLEVVQEVARALAWAYPQLGPDWKPLHLLHRDLKPGNLQITTGGEVRILDFGIAKANFEGREAHTTNDWAGTAGFAAPERMEGRDGPEGDVFSAGVVLHVLLTGDKPLGGGVFKPRKGGRQEGVRDALALAEAMMSLDPDARPTMREVESRCEALRKESWGPTLRAWAAEKVVAHQGEILDETCGLTLEEEPEEGAAQASVAPVAERDWGAPRPPVLALAETAVSPSAIPATATQTQWKAAGIGVVGGFGVAVGFAALVAVGLVAGLWIAQQPSVEPAPVAAIAAPTPVTQPATATAPIPEPSPAVAAAAPLTPATPRPAPSGAPAPAPAPVPGGTAAAAPAPVEAPAPEPAPAAAEVAAPGELFPAIFASTPSGAAVWVDGRKLGSTPLVGLQFPEGAHSVRMVLGEAAIERTIQVGPRAPKRHLWKGGDVWQDLP